MSDNINNREQSRYPIGQLDKYLSNLDIAKLLAAHFLISSVGLLVIS